MGRRLDGDGAALTVLAPAGSRARDLAGGPDGRRRPDPGPLPAWLLGLVPVAFLAVFFVWPVLTILARGASPDGLALLREPATWEVVRFTLGQAVLSTVLTLVVALPAAYVTSRYDFRGRRLLVAVVTVPFVLPTVVVGLAFRAVLPGSWTGTLGAILLAHVFFNFAVVVRVVGGLWGQLDPRYEQAARTLGASPWTVLRTVTLPLLRPALVAATVLVFLFTFTSFGVILVLGGPGTTTLEVEVYRRTAQLLDLPGAAVLAVLQMVLLGVVLLVAAWVQARGAVRQTLLAPRGSGGEPVRRAGQRLLLAGVLAVVTVLLLVPMAALVLRSFRVGDRWGLAWWRALGTVDAGTTRFAAPADSVRVSVQYALATMALSVVIGGLASCAVAYSRRGGRLLDAGAMLPLGTSAVTVGFGMLIAFGRSPLDLRGSWLLVPLAHTLIAVPLVMRAVLPVLRSVDPRLRQVAATLGASPRRAWTGVDLPLLGRALVVGAGFAFAVSLGEFGATAFLARSDTPTLPVQIVRLLGRPGQLPYGAAMALATLLMLLTAAVMLGAELLQPVVRGAAPVTGALSVQDVTVSFGAEPVLDRVALEVGPAEVVALLGPSGSGKSTLLQVVAGLLPPDAGTVRWAGEDLAAVPAHRRRFGLVFQDALLFPHLDVAGNVGYGLRVSGRPRQLVAARVAELLALVDLEGYGPRAVRTLSGGEAQRVALARALAPAPRLLLLDEPFGALDRDLRDRLAVDVRALLHRLSTPAVHVTHDLAEAELVADRVLRLPELSGAAARFDPP